MPLAPTINTNDTDISKLKGPATICRMCKNADLPKPLRIHCKFCLGSGYVALCLPCNGSGKVGAPDAWGGGSIHRSTCNTCGGVGLIPAREPEPTPSEGVVIMPKDAADGTEVSEVINTTKEAEDGKGKQPETKPQESAIPPAVAAVNQAGPQDHQKPA